MSSSAIQEVEVDKSTHPQIDSWNDLLGPKHQGFNHASCPKNPKCKVSTDACSKNMSSKDLCFWHSKRMGKLDKYSCGCSNHFIVSGDVIGRKLAYDYYGLDRNTTPVIGLCGNDIYCCGKCMNADSEVFICGVLKMNNNFRVGKCCSDRHQSNKLTIINSKDYDSDS
jgi:hypothetical protein